MSAPLRLAARAVFALFALYCACPLVCSAYLVAPELRPQVGERGRVRPSDGPEDKPARAASYLPDNLAIVVVLRDGDRRLVDLRSFFESDTFTASAPGEALLSNPQFAQARIGALGLAAAAGAEPWNAAGAIVGRELIFGIAPGTGHRPQVIVASVSRDAAVLDRVLDSALALGGLKQKGEPNPEKSELIGDVRVYTPGPFVCFCRVDDALLVANSKALLKAALDAHRDGKGRLGDSPTYRAAEKRVPVGALLWATADLKTVRELLFKGRPLPEQLPNPVAGFLLGGWLHVVAHADAAAAWVEHRGDKLKLVIDVPVEKPLPETHRGFMPAAKRSSEYGAGGKSEETPGDKPAEKRGASAPPPQWSTHALSRFMGEIRVERGWAELFAEREALLTLPAAGDLVNFSTTMSTLLGGLDFAEDVLPNIAGPLRFVAARQEFKPGDYDPTPRLPAFALDVPLRPDAPADLARRLQSGSQMAMSLLNLNAGQQQKPSYMMDIDNYRGVKIVTMQHTPPGESDMEMASPEVADRKKGAREAAESQPASEEGDGGARSGGKARRVGVRYNFAPAAAVFDNHLIIAASLDLMHELIDVIRPESDSRPEPAEKAVRTREASSAATVDDFVVEIPEAVRLLRENRRELVTNRMLEESQSRAEAEHDIDALLGILDFADRLRAGWRLTDKSYEATLELTIRDPEVARKSSAAGKGDKTETAR